MMIYSWRVFNVILLLLCFLIKCHSLGPPVRNLAVKECILYLRESANSSPGLRRYIEQFQEKDLDEDNAITHLLKMACNVTDVPARLPEPIVIPSDSPYTTTRSPRTARDRNRPDSEYCKQNGQRYAKELLGELMPQWAYEEIVPVKGWMISRSLVGYPYLPVSFTMTFDELTLSYLPNAHLMIPILFRNPSAHYIRNVSVSVYMPNITGGLDMIVNKSLSVSREQWATFNLKGLLYDRSYACFCRTTTVFVRCHGCGRNEVFLGMRDHNPIKQCIRNQPKLHVIIRPSAKLSRAVQYISEHETSRCEPFVGSCGAGVAMPAAPDDATPSDGDSTENSNATNPVLREDYRTFLHDYLDQTYSHIQKSEHDHH